MENRQTIAVDMDDVLADYARPFAKYAKEKWNVTISPHIVTEDWATLFGIDEAEWARRAEQFFANDDFTKSQLPVDGAVNALEELSHRYNIMVVTSRPISQELATVKWVEKYCGDIVSGVKFSGIWDKDLSSSAKRTKANVCQMLGVNYLIDDQPKHCNAVAECGIHALMFGDYGWNHDAKMNEGVTRVKDWNEVLEYFGGHNG